MTISISNNAAALTILQQTATQDLTGQQTATDKIIDLVSGKTEGSTATDALSKTAAKAQSLADAEKKETGTVSSEMSKSYSGAISQAVQSSMNDMWVKGSDYERELWKATLENGSAVATVLINSVLRYNNPPQAKEILTREEFNKRIPETIEKNLAMGIDPKHIEERASYWRSDNGYEDYVDTINRINKHNERIDTDVLIEGFNMLGGQFGYRFGVTPKLSFDDAGQAQVAAFEVKYANGQTMMSYDGTGNLKAYNADGSEYKSFIQSYGE